MNKLTLFWFVVLAVGLSLIILSFAPEKEIDKNQADLLTAIGTEDTDDSIPLDSGVILPILCSLGGEVVSNTSSAQDDNAYIEYRNVRHQSRIIAWTIYPAISPDEFSITPDTFKGLQVPYGREPVAFNFHSQPTTGEYKIKAAISYTNWVDGELKTFYSPCSGQILVKID